MAHNWSQNSVSSSDLVTSLEGCLWNNDGSDISTQNQDGDFFMPDLLEGYQNPSQENQNSNENQVTNFGEGTQIPSNDQPIEIMMETVVEQSHVERVESGRKDNKGKGTRKEKRSRQMTEKEYNNKSSKYLGVTKYSDNRYETFLWVNDDGSNSRRKSSGKTVYIGKFGTEIEAAKAHDIVAIKIWGESTTHTNFPVSDYSNEISKMKNMSEKEWILAVRRAGRKTGSEYIGVSRVENNKWEARLENKNGKPGLLIGTFDTEKEAARQHDVVARKLVGEKAMTNFGPNDDDDNLETMETETLQNEQGINYISSPQKEQTVEEDVHFQITENEAAYHHQQQPAINVAAPFNNDQNYDTFQSNSFAPNSWSDVGGEFGIEENMFGYYDGGFGLQDFDQAPVQNDYDNDVISEYLKSCYMEEEQNTGGNMSEFTPK